MNNKNIVPLTYIFKGSGFQNMNKPNKRRKNIENILQNVQLSQDVSKSSMRSYVVPIGTLLSLGGLSIYAIYGSYMTMNSNINAFSNLIHGRGFQDFDRKSKKNKYNKVEIPTVETPKLNKKSSFWVPILMSIPISALSLYGGFYLLANINIIEHNIRSFIEHISNGNGNGNDDDFELYEPLLAIIDNNEDWFPVIRNRRPG